MVQLGRLLKESGDKPKKLPLTTFDQGSLAVARALYIKGSNRFSRLKCSNRSEIAQTNDK